MTLTRSVEQQTARHGGYAVVAATSDEVAVEALDGRLREAVRSSGVDPQRDGARVRALAEELVRAHDERSLTGAVVPLGDPGAVVAELVARLAGFGPLQVFLDDPEAEEFRS